MTSKEKEVRCIMCGRVIVQEKSFDPWEDEDDFIPKPKKTVSFCQLCEAKLRKESDDQMKGTKPI
ncbi:hypothetical protein [Desulforamulus hydrothermalis]|uniref:DUF2197 domain-containing protein n=1 Tax=Desulforamulus hydrothermalis Lam5 = DSM 18033 TaxID=1121428 RepID=K8DX65_9FIRM|nr:hypothetical protein [Desulforamulus hydrothermalis]CCO07109.1 conserved hypothetical protein [Desulforamulus hydrothermalis Lam5 = DSM 18033]SHG89964.1 hypothetical protein SAMN02745177_00765 [Desulforamulus hydrothermalis Lam5 = DSM 18033]